MTFSRLLTVSGSRFHGIPPTADATCQLGLCTAKRTYPYEGPRVRVHCQPGTGNRTGELQLQYGFQIGAGLELPAAHHLNAPCAALCPPCVGQVGLAHGRVRGRAQESGEFAAALVVVDDDKSPSRPEHPQDLGHARGAVRRPEISKPGMDDIRAGVIEGQVLRRTGHHLGAPIPARRQFEQGGVGLHSDDAGGVVGVAKQPVAAAAAQVDQGPARPRRK